MSDFRVEAASFSPRSRDKAAQPSGNWGKGQGEKPGSLKSVQFELAKSSSRPKIKIDDTAKPPEQEKFVEAKKKPRRDRPRGVKTKKEEKKQDQDEDQDVICIRVGHINVSLKSCRELQKLISKIEKTRVRFIPHLDSAPKG